MILHAATDMAPMHRKATALSHSQRVYMREPYFEGIGVRRLREQTLEGKQWEVSKVRSTGGRQEGMTKDVGPPNTS